MPKIVGVRKTKSTGANEEAQEEEQQQPNLKNPYCGHENTIFKWIDQSTGEWHRCCEETPKPEGAKVAKDSILMAWERQGRSLSCQTETIASSVGNNLVLQALLAGSQKRESDHQAKSIQEMHEYLSRFEGWMMAIIPESPFSKVRDKNEDKVRESNFSRSIFT